MVDPRLPVSRGMKTTDVVKAMVGLLSLGKSDFEAIEPFRNDRFFKEALGLSNMTTDSGLSLQDHQLLVPEYDRSIAWNDPDLAIDWPLAGLNLPGGQPILAPKDAAAPRLAQAEVYA